MKSAKELKQFDSVPRLNLIEILSENGQKYTQLCHLHQAIKKINDKFDLPGRGQKRSARSSENVLRMKDVFDKNSNKSSARASSELYISKTSVLMIMRLRIFRPKFVHKDDFDQLEMEW